VKLVRNKLRLIFFPVFLSSLPSFLTVPFTSPFFGYYFLINNSGYMFCEEELVTILKGLKNNKAPDADSVINEFLKYAGSEVRNKLLKIMNMIFEKEEVPNDFRKTLIKPLYKKVDASECRNYRN